ASMPRKRCWSRWRDVAAVCDRCWWRMQPPSVALQLDRMHPTPFLHVHEVRWLRTAAASWGVARALPAILPATGFLPAAEVGPHLELLAASNAFPADSARLVPADLDGDGDLDLVYLPHA